MKERKRECEGKKKKVRKRECEKKRKRENEDASKRSDIDQNDRNNNALKLSVHDYVESRLCIR